jgi:hypothetical protein
MHGTEDWVAEFHRTGNWLDLANWLMRRNTYLAKGMRGFVENAAAGEFGTDAGTPSAKQIALLVSLRGGVEALMRLEAARQAEEPDESHRPRCGARTWAGHPCGHPVNKPGDRCRLHSGRRGSTSHESEQRRLPPRLLQ